MALNEQEAKLLEELKLKEAQSLDDKDLDAMEKNIETLYDYKDAFGALMIWNRFSQHLSTLADDNGKLVREVKRLRANENSKPMKGV